MEVAPLSFYFLLLNFLALLWLPHLIGNFPFTHPGYLSVGLCTLICEDISIFSLFEIIPLLYSGVSLRHLPWVLTSVGPRAGSINGDADFHTSSVLCWFFSVLRSGSILQGHTPREGCAHVNIYRCSGIRPGSYFETFAEPTVCTTPSPHTCTVPFFTWRKFPGMERRIPTLLFICTPCPGFPIRPPGNLNTKALTEWSLEHQLSSTPPSRTFLRGYFHVFGIFVLGI